MRKFLLTGLVFLTIAAGLTWYFRQRSPHRSGTWVIEPGYGEYYALHPVGPGPSRFLVKLQTASPGTYAIYPIDAATRARISLPIKDLASLKLPPTRELDGPVSEILDFPQAPDYLFIYNLGSSRLTIGYDIEKMAG